MVAGRPERDLEALAADLLQWSTNPTSFNLIQFTRPRMMSVTILPDYASKDKKFSEALRLTKESLAMNRFEAMLDGAMPLDEYKRNEHQYDPQRSKLIKDDKLFDLSIEKKKLKYAASLKSVEVSTSPNQSSLDSSHENMILKAKLAEFENANKS